MRLSRTAISRWSPRGSRWWCCTTGRITTACSAPRDCSPPTAVQAVRRTERLRFDFPRQRRDRHLCLADFVRSRESGQVDVLPVQLVTAGSKIEEVTSGLFAGNHYRDYYELNGLVMQLTEALAEFWHARIRSELGFAAEEPKDKAGYFKLDYRGARFSLGYPACPDMEDRRKVTELLRPERMGVVLSDELMLHPEQSTDAFVFHHPEAKYFKV